MKKDWTYKKLGELCKIATGKHDANHAKENGQYRFYTCAAQYLMCDTFTFDGDCLILPGNGANVGDVYLFSGKFDAYQRTYVLSQIKEEVLCKYLYYYFICKWKKQGTAKQYGAATNYIIMSNFTDFVVAYPPLSEQSRIVSHLDAAFGEIEGLKAKAEAQLSEARALFQAALTKEMKPKQGWEEKKFGEVCLYFKEQDIYKNMKYIGMEHIESGTGKLLGFINSNDVLSSSFHFTKGDVLYGRLRPYLKKVYLADFDGCCSTEIFPIKSEAVEAGFIKYWFLSDEITNKINATSAGCRMPRGNMNEVKSFQFFFPKDKTVQQSIVSRLDALSEKVRELEEAQKKVIAECDALKQALLREVFE